MESAGGGEQSCEVRGGAARDRLWLAEGDEGAGAAFRAELGWRCAAPGEQGAHGGGELAGFRAERFIEAHLLPAMRRAIEERASGHGRGEHLFEADRLRAELDGVDGLGFGAAALVLDGEGAPDAVGLAVKLHDIGDTMQTERRGLERERAGGAEIAA